MTDVNEKTLVEQIRSAHITATYGTRNQAEAYSKLRNLVEIVAIEGDRRLAELRAQLEEARATNHRQANDIGALEKFLEQSGTAFIHAGVPATTEAVNRIRELRAKVAELDAELTEASGLYERRLKNAWTVRDEARAELARLRSQPCPEPSDEEVALAMANAYQRENAGPPIDRFEDLAVLMFGPQVMLMYARAARELFRGRRGAEASEEGKTWRCFHCDEVFTDEATAEEHFGAEQLPSMHSRRPSDKPACSFSDAYVRDLETQLNGYRGEDSDKDRAMYKMQSEHDIALRREEEKGYERGLRDGKKAVRPSQPPKCTTCGGKLWVNGNECFEPCDACAEGQKLAERIAELWECNPKRQPRQERSAETTELRKPLTTWCNIPGDDWRSNARLADVLEAIVAAIERLQSDVAGKLTVTDEMRTAAKRELTDVAAYRAECEADGVESASGLLSESLARAVGGGGR